VAAGRGERMGGVDKMFAQLGDKPILVRAINTFQKCKSVDHIVVVVSGENLEPCRHLVAEQGWNKVTEVCLGGERRQDSVAAGLKRLDSCHWVVIHDGARPLVTVELIEQGCRVD